MGSARSIWGKVGVGIVVRMDMIYQASGKTAQVIEENERR